MHRRRNILLLCQGFQDLRSQKMVIKHILITCCKLVIKVLFHNYWKQKWYLSTITKYSLKKVIKYNYLITFLPKMVIKLLSN